MKAAAIGALSMLMSEPTAKSNVKRTCMFVLLTGDVTLQSLLVATFCAHLASLLRGVAKCWALKIDLVRMPRRSIVAQTWPNNHSSSCNIHNCSWKICGLLYRKIWFPNKSICPHHQDHASRMSNDIWANSTQYVATPPNTLQQCGQKNAHNMSCLTMLRYVALKCCSCLTMALSFEKMYMLDMLHTVQLNTYLAATYMCWMATWPLLGSH